MTEMKTKRDGAEQPTGLGEDATPTVERQTDGTFVIVSAGHIASRPFASSAEAWRALDRMEGEPINKAEQKSEWLWSKIVSGNP